MAPISKRAKEQKDVSKAVHVNKETRASNIVKCLLNFQRGMVESQQVKNLGEYFVTEHLKKFYIWQVHSHFEKRVTAINWHPNNYHFLVVGSKGGDMLFLDVHRKMRPIVCTGIGPGGSITSIAFDPFSDGHLFTTSVDGTVKRWDIETTNFSILLETYCFEKWYCSVNVSQETGLVVAGDSKGYLTLMGKDLKVLRNCRLHKSKVCSAEFCKGRSWLLATASIDATMKIWDVRKLTAPLHTRPHERPVNSGYFSFTDSNRLLTTDQHSQLRVYRGPLWELETLIQHPHRQFQHLTPIKASWHPGSDVVVVGRYPDPALPGYRPGDPRTIDLFSAGSGKLLARLNPPEVSNIVSLSAFNRTGDYFACGAGLHTPVWRCRFPKQISKKGTKDDDDDDDDDKPPSPPPSRLRSKKNAPPKVPKAKNVKKPK